MGFEPTTFSLGSFTEYRNIMPFHRIFHRSFHYCKALIFFAASCMAVSVVCVYILAVMEMSECPMRYRATLMQAAQQQAMNAVSSWWELDFTKFVPAMGFIAGIFADIFAQLGDFSVVIAMPLVVGLALMFIGRGTQASRQAMRYKKMTAGKSGKKGKKG